ncbi:MAG: DUF1275 domain-containing protein [Labilithrix sp.]|nr:DUF1275 domain-containing protein [Labilithrix sp.]MCW5837211.1 DUF1275 domain-containing protein [Labilithrix sp.]
MNASAVMACQNFVTHITGNVTNLAADAPRAADYMFVIASFIGGGMIAVLIGEMMRARPKAAFALPLLASFVTLLGIAVAGKTGIFGAFGVDDHDNERAFIMLGLLAAVMGMVNASLGVATDNKIRVTHLTGPATDLAGNIVRAALGAGAGHAAEARWATLRFAKLAAFAVGAGLAVKSAPRLQYDLFAVAAGILIVALGFTGAPASADASALHAPKERPKTKKSSSGEPPVVRPHHYEDALPLTAPSASDDASDRNAAE